MDFFRRKKVLVIMLALLLAITGFTACSSGDDGGEEKAKVELDENLQGIYDKIDIDFAVETADKVAESGTAEDTGYRLAGSKGEDEAVNYLEKRFAEAGLQDVTVHETEVATWSMTNCDLTYTGTDGKEQSMVLGSYQTTFKSDNKEYEMLYLNEATAKDYEGIDAKGKVILLDIDQSENWWINWPAYQAKVKGAACVIAANSGGYGQLNGKTLQAQDICGPADAPALSITNDDADVLKKLIKDSGSNSIKVKIDCDAEVKEDGKSHNVSGVIPGKTDETIFLIAHLDGYFHAWHDNASGVGMELAIAKAIIDSGYKPQKTIRVVAHGAEEWGITDSRYDWMTGAYEQINKVTPEWAENGAVVLNCESGCARDDDEYLALGINYELQDLAQGVLDKIDANSPWKKASKAEAPATCWSEDFVYARAGIPGMVTRKTSGNFNLNSYHSNQDLKEDHYSEDHYMFSHQVYASMLYEYDNLSVTPLDFGARVAAAEESVSEFCPDKDNLTASMAKAKEASDSLMAKVKDMNKAETTAEEATAMNSEMRKIFTFAQNNIVAFDWEDNVQFPHDAVQTNMENLEASIKALEKGDVKTVVDDLLFNIDYNWYAYDWDKETYEHFVDQALKADKDKLVWGEGMIVQGNENLFDVVKSLNGKYEESNADVSKEIATLKKALENQQKIGAKVIKDEIADINKLTEMMNGLLK